MSENTKELIAVCAVVALMILCALGAMAAIVFTATYGCVR